MRKSAAKKAFLKYLSSSHLSLNETLHAGVRTEVPDDSSMLITSKEPFALDNDMTMFSPGEVEQLRALECEDVGNMNLQDFLEVRTRG